MSVYDIIIHATRNRIYMLEKMMDLIAEQIMYLENNKKLLNQLLLEYNVDFVKHKYLVIYYENLTKLCLTSGASFKNTILAHLKALEEMSVESFLSEIEGHQIALSDLLNASLFNNSSADTMLKAVYDFFPYEIVLPMFLDYNFCSQFFKLVIEFKQDKRKIILNKILGLFESKYQSQKFIFIIIADMLLSYFIYNYSNNDSQENYKVIINDKLDKIMFDKNELISLQNSCKITDMFHVKPYVKQLNIVEIELFDSSKLNNEIIGLNYITLEFRKIACQPSVSMKALFILRVSDMLKSEILSIKSTLPGADELFKFYVYLTCDAGLFNWRAFINDIDNNCFDFVKSSKVGYYIEQLKSVTEFIEKLKYK